MVERDVHETDAVRRDTDERATPAARGDDDYPDADGNTGDRIAAGDAPSDDDRLERRLAAVERAVTGDGAVVDLSDERRLESRLDEVEAAVADAERRLDELDAATQALRGYVGSVRAVNREVESRADLALATARRVERHCLRTGGRSTTRDGEVEEDARPGRGDELAQADVRRNDVRTAPLGAEVGETAPNEPAVAAALPDDGDDRNTGSPRSRSRSGESVDVGVLDRLRDVL